MTTHELVVEGVDGTENGVRIAFGCTCGGYTAEETAATQADAVALAGNEVRMHAAAATGAPSAEIRF